ncbi:MAG TPA: T9SS type A sorting domain-containing protein [Bacteroidota bacterium]|jgi:hypothetical protein|nr:T9SS type A sorting domain-containing protein [Bacteroidota bacterium]
MKYLVLIFGLMVAVSLAEAQVTNLVVNGVSSNFSFVSGDAVSWSYNLPTGATADCELWYDVNQNGVADPATDVLIFAFGQTDGVSNGNGGPPDMDGLVNGSISFSQPVGLAPGKYIFKAKNNGTGLAVAGTVSPLASPVHSISGHVTPPAGKSARYIFVEVHRNDQAGQPNFWDGVTDSSGNYTIEMNADTAGNPWQIRINSNPFPPSIITPDQIELVITGNHSGNNFTFVQAAAQVAGHVKDDNGNDLSQVGVQLRRSDGLVQHNGQTGASGFFQIGLQAGELTGDTWMLGTDCNCQGVTQSILTTQFNLPSISATDSLYRTLIVYSVNSQIKGKVKVNGSPVNYSLQLFATNDTAYSQTNTDSVTGNFTAAVSNKIGTYHFQMGGLPFGWEVEQTLAHPGDSGVVVNIVTQTNMLVTWADSWNMLSLPVKVIDNQKANLFPQAVSAAFSYSSAGGYQPQTNLLNGVGYWIKFSGSNATSINGTYLASETLSVQNGWNMVGGPSCLFPTSAVIAVGTTISSPFFAYTTGYSASDTLRPGLAYWVKCTGAGQIIIDCGNATGAPRTRIPRIVDEYPPPPPEYDGKTPDSKPMSDALLKNYPNPFNPTTSIKYSIAESRFVRLKVYNVLGQEVASLVNEVKQPGEYSALWDASNLPSGIYMVRMSVGNFVQSEKMLLMK